MRQHVDSKVWKAMALGAFILGGCAAQGEKALEKEDPNHKEESQQETPGLDPARDVQHSAAKKEIGFHPSTPQAGEGSPPKSPIEFGNDASVHIHIETKGDSIAYNYKRIVVPSGSQIMIDLQNNASLDVMVHNLVIVKKGHADEVGVAALSVGPERGYIPDLDVVLAHSALVGPGESTHFEFSAPPPGEYDFVCTYPGHYAFMRGVFVVETPKALSTGGEDTR